MKNKSVPGVAVVVVKDGKIALLKGWGQRNVEERLPVDPETTLFRIGSSSKALTGLALLQLVHEGKVDLNAPVSSYVDLAAVKNTSKGTVLVKHLLEHTSGFDQRGIGRQGEQEGRASIREFLSQELRVVRTPGVVPVYDTYGITLAGHLIEAVSGKSYATYMREDFFEPLGMRHSWIEVSSQAPSVSKQRLARGYGIEDDKLTPQEYEWYVTLPASSIDSTAADMGKLLLALLSNNPKPNSPISSETLELLGEPQRTYPGGLKAFSYAWWESERNGWRALNHGGLMAGYSSELLIVPEADLGLFVVCNRDPETGPDPGLREAVVQLVLEEMLAQNPTKAAPVPVVDQPIDLNAYAGPYANIMGCFTCEEGAGWPLATLSFEIEDGALALGPQRWAPRNAEVFQLKGSERRIAFLKDPETGAKYFMNGTNSWVRMDDALLATVLGPEWKKGPANPLVATTYRAAGKWLEAADVYLELAKATPTEGRHQFNAGFAFLNAKRYDDALAAFIRAEELKRWVPWSIYYQGAARAAKGEKAEALKLLAKAIDAGFDDPNLLDNEPWWAELRSDDDFKSLRNRIAVH